MKQQGKRAYFVFGLLCRYQITSNQITLSTGPTKNIAMNS